MSEPIFLRPSSASRWTACGGSAALERQFPDQETGDAAREGTCAAWVAECVLRGDASSAADLVGRVHENGCEVDEDMAIFVQFYIDEVHRLAEGGQILVEHKVSIPPFVNGTLDSCVWVHVGPLLRVIDLKYGWGIVEPKKNPQLICYGAGLIEQTGWRPTTIELIIIQPRPVHPDGPTRTWSVDGNEFNSWVEWIKACAQVAQSPNAPFVAGPQCTHCLAAHACATLTTEIYNRFEKVSARSILRLEDERIGVEMDFLDTVYGLVKARRDAVQADLRARLEGGRIIPGWAMLPTQGKRQFTAHPAAIYAMTGVDPFEQKLVTPSELERRGASKEIVSRLTTTPTVGRKPSRVDDSVAERMFGPAKQQP